MTTAYQAAVPPACRLPSRAPFARAKNAHVISSGAERNTGYLEG
jgi:hypothetical protein